jgi:hypothetical protein
MFKAKSKGQIMQLRV